jgi:hypothetical protein
LFESGWPRTTDPHAALGPVNEEPVADVRERGVGAVQADLVLDQPRADQAKGAAAVQPRQPGLAIELSHSAAEPVTPAELVGVGVPVQRDESTRLALVISVQRPEVGDGAIVAKLVQEVR